MKALLTLIKAIKVDADADAVAFNLRAERHPCLLPSMRPNYAALCPQG